MMNKLISMLLGFGVVLFGQAHAQTQDSFEREFSKFDKDFERLNTWKAETPASKKLKRAPTPVEAPSASDPGTTPLDAESPVPHKTEESPSETAKPAKPANPNNAASDKTSALPKGAKVERLARSDRLGNQISDPEMRKKVQALYRRSDVVVQQYVLPTN